MSGRGRDCLGLGAGCCLALLLHSTLLGALIPQAYERERGGSGRKGDGRRKESERERWGGGGGGVEGKDVISIVTMMLVYGVQDYVCAKYT